MEAGTLYALGAGCCYGGYLTATRWTAATAPPVMALFSQLMVGTALLAPAGLPELARFGVVEPALLCLLALPSMVANLLAILAYRFSRASALAPLVYVQILSATAIGYWVFADLPDAVAATGLGLIMGSGLLMLWRSRKGG
jgi:drug/metabolite transporter (DMT)-like permease